MHVDHKTKRRLQFAILAATTFVAACGSQQGEDDASIFAVASRTCTLAPSQAIKIPAGSFAMGQEDIYLEEGPIREVTVDGFWIDPTEVTNAQFAAFVEETGYQTVAEKPVDPAIFGVPVSQIPPSMLEPGSAVFEAPEEASRMHMDWWEYRPGANWRMPTGPDGEAADPDRPVVHLAYEDMQAYASWRGGRIPTEAEWEYAARAGDPNYTDQPSEANSWQGVFPVKDFAEDGFAGVAPVGCYKPNNWGLFDMVGNVWEVTSDFYAPGHDPRAGNVNPRGPSQNAAYDPANPGLPSRVMKGGSFLCAPNYCQRYRPASRQGRDPGLGASNVGFRLVYDSAPQAQEGS